LSPDGHRLYALSSDGTVSVLDATTGTQLGQFSTPGAVAFLTVGVR
jgi:DNA-binding beta-propeller fold protein YncE